MEFFSKLLLSVIAIILSLPLVYLNLILFFYTDSKYILYIYIYIGSSKSKILLLLGFIWYMIVIVASMTFCLLIDKDLSEDERSAWSTIFLMSIIMNTFVIQPLKCIMIYSCVAGSPMFDIIETFSGKLRLR